MTKLCKDCKFFQSDAISPDCTNPLLVSRSFVDGSIERTYCSQRPYNRCGLEGKLFIPADDVIDWRDIKRDMDAELERDRKFDAVVERLQKEAIERRGRIANDPEAQQGAKE